MKTFYVFASAVLLVSMFVFLLYCLYAFSFLFFFFILYWFVLGGWIVCALFCLPASRTPMPLALEQRLSEWLRMCNRCGGLGYFAWPA